MQPATDSSGVAGQDGQAIAACQSEEQVCCASSCMHQQPLIPIGSGLHSGAFAGSGAAPRVHQAGQGAPPLAPAVQWQQVSVCDMRNARTCPQHAWCQHNDHSLPPQQATMRSEPLGLPPMHQSPGGFANAGFNNSCASTGTAASELSSSTSQVVDAGMLPPLKSTFVIDAAQQARIGAATCGNGAEKKPLIWDSRLFDVPGAPHFYNLEAQSNSAAPMHAASVPVLQPQRDSREALPEPPSLGVFLHDGQQQQQQRQWQPQQ